jgi:hypothetical protein
MDRYSVSHNKKITRFEGEGGKKWKEEYWKDKRI